MPPSSDTSAPAAPSNAEAGAHVFVRAFHIEGNRVLDTAQLQALRGLTSNTNQQYYRAMYQVPVGPASTRIGVAFSDMGYRLGKEMRPLGYHGRASVRSAFVMQPLLRSRRASASAQFIYENKHLRDDYGVLDFVSDKRVDLWSFAVTGNSSDDRFGGGRNVFSATLGIGRMRGNDPLGMNRFTHTHTHTAVSRSST
jgi:hemolysin activation/secretion protein